MFGLQFGIQPVLGNQRILRPGRWLWARALVWIVILIFAVMIPFGLASEWLSNALPDQPGFQFLAHGAGAVIVLSCYALLVRIGEARAPSEIALASAPMGLLAGLAIGLALFSSVMGILIGTGLYDMSFQGLAPAWRGAGLAIESGILEEVLIRGVILRLLWRSVGPWPALAVSMLLFGAGHLANPGATLLPGICVAIEGGLLLGAFYVLTGRLWVSIGVHAGWNFTQGYIFGAAVSGGDFGGAMAVSTASDQFPDWLTGGAFGPEASLLALVVCSAVGGLVLWLAWRSGRFEAWSREFAPNCAGPSTGHKPPNTTA
ncbi:CPBP family intramembrane metalloprotease [Alteraurantiacibacter aestuarii]|uniref:CPBP family intramembrane metalloprotease n=1 Tax=Alteraurantiacibacter aestuarii TaxID=650004 RepID=A0A844ZN02_9SPHN|nr:type II CAAX endopeptidase family protein [Alteraurantiacibacter aestuarii]MXO88692.1 CPBP family intramembrane metalloprotease [Alteraurantiacibacter aestuarii]